MDNANVGDSFCITHVMVGNKMAGGRDSWLGEEIRILVAVSDDFAEFRH